MKGTKVDREECKIYQHLFVECLKYDREPASNFNSLVELTKYEEDLVKRRREQTKANDVWTMRKEPPSDWNSPLPDWCQEKLKESSWYKSATSTSNKSNH